MVNFYNVKRLLYYLYKTFEIPQRSKIFFFPKMRYGHVEGSLFKHFGRFIFLEKGPPPEFSAETVSPMLISISDL